MSDLERKIMLIIRRIYAGCTPDYAGVPLRYLADHLSLTENRAEIRQALATLEQTGYVQIEYARHGQRVVLLER